jgi:hypothetical protein
LKHDIEKLNKDFIESNALIEELMNICRKGEKELKK